MSKLLNPQLCVKLREVINKTNIFIKDEKESKKFNLICSIMDRFDSTVKYINDNSDVPKTENDLIKFMMFSSIIKDGINYILKILNIEVKRDNGIFRSIYQQAPLNVPEDKHYTDDEFFEYFRSLVFAHPFLTDRSVPIPIKKGEIQYSPFVLVDLHGLRREQNSIGARVYSNKRESFSIIFSFDILKDYIKWKYEMLIDVIKGFENIIISKEEVWKLHKVDKKLDNIEILNDIKNILEERFVETDIIDDLILDLECISTNKENDRSISIYRKAIINIIPELCDVVDECNYDKMYEIVGNITMVRPKGHKMVHYQLEKIFCYLTEYSLDYNVEWGIVQAEAFSKEFAKKWVNIEPYNMDFDEIKMLTRVACYLEYQEQQNRGEE